MILCDSSYLGEVPPTNGHIGGVFSEWLRFVMTWGTYHFLTRQRRRCFQAAHGTNI